MLKTAYAAVVSGLSKYLVAILTGLLLAAGLATGMIYKQLDSARSEAVQARETAQQYLALADARKGELEAAEARHKVAIQTLNARASVAEKQAKQFKEQNRELQEALTADRDWADSPIPDGVLNALKRPSDRP